MPRLPVQGPTVFLPGTHTKAAHTEFYGGDLAAARETNGVRTAPVAEEFLRGRPVALGLLKIGDLACYNQQVLHCGSANESEDKVRTQRSTRGGARVAGRQCTLVPSPRVLHAPNLRAHRSTLRAPNTG